LLVGGVSLFRLHDLQGFFCPFDLQKLGRTITRLHQEEIRSFIVMTSQDVKSMALTAATQSPQFPINPFAVCYLQLCQVSYASQSSIPTLVTKVTPLDPGGSWQCIWGPVSNWDNSNLVFIAGYYSGSVPLLVATVVRGTDVDIDDPIGILVQIWEDMDVPFQGPLPWLNNNNVLVANGTLDALSSVQGLRSNGQRMDQFLATFLQDPANQNPVLIVTGHSLGGCLTTVVAPWLQNQLNLAQVKAPIVPATFAAPTAGNIAFAKYFDSCFSYGMRYANSLDLAPLAWRNLSNMDDIYVPCGIPIPDVAYVTIIGFIDAMWLTGAGYSQPFTNNAPLTGGCYKKTTSWYDEGYFQHHTTTYMSLLGGTNIVSENWRPRVALGEPKILEKSTLRTKLGSLKATMAKLRP
jgi:triacylglycerol lipase